MILKYLLRKEFTQIRRNSFLPRLILMFPIMVMCIMPWVMNMEVKNVVVDVVDNDRSTQSQQVNTLFSTDNSLLTPPHLMILSTRRLILWWLFRSIIVAISP